MKGRLLPPNDLFPAHERGILAREIMLGDERVRIVEAGAEGAFPIVLLHGWGASAYNFRGVMGPLASAGYRAIAPDLRGHGGSDTRLPRGAWSRQAMVGWIQQLLDALGVGDCVMVGQSIDGVEWARIQCTPDLQPTDVTGLSIFNQREREFERLEPVS